MSIPWPVQIKHEGTYRGNGPPDGPGAPDARGSQRGPGQKGCQRHTEDQVGKGGDHEFAHHAGAAEYAVRYQLGRDNKVKWREDTKKHDPGL